MSDALVVSCGSRAHLEEESVATRSVFRTVLMYGFHTLVWLFAVRGVRDTQCGFKLLTRRAARILFNSLHVERWSVLFCYFARKEVSGNNVVGLEVRKERNKSSQWLVAGK